MANKCFDINSCSCYPFTLNEFIGWGDEESVVSRFFCRTWGLHHVTSTLEIFLKKRWGCYRHKPFLWKWLWQEQVWKTNCTLIVFFHGLYLWPFGEATLEFAHKFKLGNFCAQQWSWRNSSVPELKEKVVTKRVCKTCDNSSLTSKSRFLYFQRRDHGDSNSRYGKSIAFDWQPCVIHCSGRKHTVRAGRHWNTSVRNTQLTYVYHNHGDDLHERFLQASGASLERNDDSGRGYDGQRRFVDSHFGSYYLYNANRYFVLARRASYSWEYMIGYFPDLFLYDCSCSQPQVLAWLVFSNSLVSLIVQENKMFRQILPAVSRRFAGCAR